MFQSTPSGGKATLEAGTGIGRVLFQSTPSGGKATRRPAELRDISVVSIHAFRGEGDAVPDVFAVGVVVVSIHAFRGEGDLGDTLSDAVQPVSIHAFRGEGDPNAGDVLVIVEFQSTPSGGKATCWA